MAPTSQREQGGGRGIFNLEFYIQPLSISMRVEKDIFQIETDSNQLTSHARCLKNLLEDAFQQNEVVSQGRESGWEDGRAGGEPGVQHSLEWDGSLLQEGDQGGKWIRTSLGESHHSGIVSRELKEPQGNK